MARLPYLDPGDLAPEDRDLLKRPINLFRQLVHSPGAARALSGLGGYIRHTSTLDPRLREMAILQVGYLARSEYEYTHHVRLGTEQFGVSPSDIEAITAETEGRDSGLGDLDRAVLSAARAMVTDLAIPDAEFAVLEASLSREHLVDLVVAIAFYCAVVRVLATLEIDNEPHYASVLERFPLPD